MRNEADLKRIFKNSITKRRGYCTSLATGAISGVPDLYCILPGYIPILIEAKFFPKELPTKFKRKIPYSPTQKHFLEKVNNACPGSAWGLIGFKWLGETYAAMTKPEVEYLEPSTKGVWLKYDKHTKLFGPITLYHMFEIPKIEKSKVIDIPVLVPLSIPI